MNIKPVLLVEDDSNDVFFFERAIRKIAPTQPLRVARDGREAISYLSGIGPFADRSLFPLPGLIVLDLNLPHQHGLEVLPWIREFAPDPAVPVVVLTSSTSDRDMREAYRLGANSFLSKPSRPDELVDLVRGLKLKWFDCHPVLAVPAPHQIARLQVCS